MKTKVPGWLTLPLVLGAFAALVWLERKRPLRSEVEPKLTRGARNLAVAGVSAVALQLTESPVAFKLTALVEQHYLGLLKRLPLPAWLEVALAVILLDYTLYVWHVLTHNVPFLWRFHVAHHMGQIVFVTKMLKEESVDGLWSRTHRDSGARRSLA